MNTLVDTEDALPPQCMAAAAIRRGAGLTVDRKDNMDGVVLVRELKTNCGSAFHLALVRFDACSFDSGEFELAGIACPPALARSVQKRQAEFFFGRLAARRAIRDHGLPDADIPIGADREPVWPAGIVGSISHTAALAVAIVGAHSCHLGLGVDVERVASPEARQALCDVAVNADELACLQRHGGSMPLAELVTLAFSAKESFYKAAFGTVRRFFDFDAAHVTRLDTARSTIELTLQEDLHAYFPRGHRCEVSYERLDESNLLTLFDARRRPCDERGFGVGASCGGLNDRAHAVPRH